MISQSVQMELTIFYFTEFSGYTILWILFCVEYWNKRKHLWEFWYMVVSRTYWYSWKSYFNRVPVPDEANRVTALFLNAEGMREMGAECLKSEDEVWRNKPEAALVGRMDWHGISWSGWDGQTLSRLFGGSCCCC